MTKGQVFEVIKRNIVETLDDVDERRIVATSSLKELGANSIDIVEVVSRSMRELGVKVQRAELAAAVDIEGLVELLFRAANRSGEPSP